MNFLSSIKSTVTTKIASLTSTPVEQDEGFKKALQQLDDLGNAVKLLEQRVREWMKILTELSKNNHQGAQFYSSLSVRFPFLKINETTELYEGLQNRILNSVISSIRKKLESDMIKPILADREMDSLTTNFLNQRKSILQEIEQSKLAVQSHNPEKQQLGKEKYEKAAEEFRRHHNLLMDHLQKRVQTRATLLAACVHQMIEAQRTFSTCVTAEFSELSNVISLQPAPIEITDIFSEGVKLPVVIEKQPPHTPAPSPAPAPKQTTPSAPQPQPQQKPVQSHQPSTQQQASSSQQKQDSNLHTPQKAQQKPVQSQAKPNNNDAPLFDIDDEPSQHQSTSTKTSNSEDDWFENLGSPSSTAEAQANSAPNSFGDAFSSMDPFTASSAPAQANASTTDDYFTKFTTPKAQQQQNKNYFDLGANSGQSANPAASNDLMENFFSSGTTSQSTATAPQEVVPKVHSSWDNSEEMNQREDRKIVTNTKAFRVHANVEGAVQEFKERENRQLDEQSKRLEMDKEISEKVEKWAGGCKDNTRALLSTLHTILWPEANWEKCDLSQIISDGALRKKYLRALNVVHPDKVQNETVERKIIAERVFDILKTSYK